MGVLGSCVPKREVPNRTHIRAQPIAVDNLEADGASAIDFCATGIAGRVTPWAVRQVTLAEQFLILLGSERVTNASSRRVSR